MALLFSAARRRARRQRALARHQWFLHRTKIQCLGAGGLRSILRKLSTHHSRDLKFLSAIRREIQVTMASSYQTYPWKCPCGSLNGKRAVHCPICAQHRSVGTPHSNLPKQHGHHQQPSQPSQKWKQRPNTPKQGQSWQQQQDWEQDGQWIQSPRRRSSRPRSNSNRTRSQKGRGKGKHKEGPAAQFAAMPDQGSVPGPPAVLPTYQEAPWLMAPPPPIPQGNLPGESTAASVAASAAETKLKNMYALLEKHPDGLHPDIQKEIKDAKLKEGEVAIKSLHKQVNALGKARTELQNANAARLGLHSSWRGFLVEQVAKWQAYSQQFQQQEAQLAERVATARAALDTARSSLAVSKSLLQKSDQQDQQDITTVSDEEEESREAKEAANSSAKKITDSLQELGQSLKTLSANADEMMQAEAQAHKRQRLEPPAPEAGSATSGGDASFR